MKDTADQMRAMESILATVWSAALDAQHMLTQEGGSELKYLQKQRDHFDKAKKAIIEVMS